jgi:hypothetical protein
VIWTKQFGTGADDRARSVTADVLGNVYIAGLTAGSLGGPNAGGEDVFLSKHDAGGNLLWMRQLGTSADDGRLDVGTGVGVSVDALGNVYVASDTEGNLGGPSAGERDPFLAKYDTAGNLLWIEQYGTDSHESAYGVSADGLGGVYVSGSSCARYCVGVLTKFHDQTLAGDFNNDGSVNAADYVVWREGLGTKYTQADYNVWRAHFGRTAAGTAALAAALPAVVPEPSTLCAACAAASFIYALRYGSKNQSVQLPMPTDRGE